MAKTGSGYRKAVDVTAAFAAAGSSAVLMRNGLQRIVDAFQNIPLGKAGPEKGLHGDIQKTATDRNNGFCGSMLRSISAIPAAAVAAAVPEVPGGSIATHSVHRLYECRRWPVHFIL